MAAISKKIMNSVVNIGRQLGESEVVWCGTGVVARFVKSVNNSHTTREQNLMLITSSHVVVGQKIIQLQFHRSHQTDSRIMEIPLFAPDGSRRWFSHPEDNVDLCVVPLPGLDLPVECVEFPTDFFTLADMAQSQILEGEFVYVIGYPNDIGPPERPSVIVRGGVISSIYDTVIDNTKNFLVDVNVLPGNSGGPVLLERRDDEPVNKIVGIIQGYVSYKEILYSRQTGEPKEVTVENSGLAVVVSSDAISDIVFDTSLFAPGREANR